jgi:hypothetical protein
MKITNFSPEKLNNSKELMFFDNCLVEYFNDIEFSLFGSIELMFEDGEFDYCDVNIMFSQDEEGKRINLSKEIKYKIEIELSRIVEKSKK